MEANATRPLWRRIFDFPLVTMIVAVALFVGANAAGLLIAKLLPPMSSEATLIAKSLINILLVLAVYKFVIRKLGEQPRDDLRPAGAVKGLAIGLAIGFDVLQRA